MHLEVLNLLILLALRIFSCRSFFLRPVTFEVYKTRNAHLFV